MLKFCFKMKHVGRDPREKLQKLSCHRLPGVDIRPGEKKTQRKIFHISFQVS